MARSPSQALLDRYAAALNARAITVTYYAYRSRGGNVDPVTDEIRDEVLAYAAGISLDALIIYSPSESIRGRFGLDDPVTALVEIPLVTLNANSIIPKEGDKLTIPQSEYPVYVVRVLPTKQVAGKHITRLLAVKQKKGRGRA